jgi:multicomponent Na+:H+ antiporter subunit C
MDGARGEAAHVSYLPYGVAVWLFVVGLYGVVTSRNLIHLSVCLTVMQSSTYVLLVAIGYKDRGTAPIFFGVPVGTRAVDPVVQALTLTDIVVSVTVVALILSLALDVHERAKTLEPDRIAELEG